MTTKTKSGSIEIGRRIQAARKARNMSQAALAEKAGFGSVLSCNSMRINTNTTPASSLRIITTTMSGSWWQSMSAFLRMIPGKRPRLKSSGNTMRNSSRGIPTGFLLASMPMRVSAAHRSSIGINSTE